MHQQALSIHCKLVALGFSSEDGVIVQNQTGLARTVSSPEEGGGKHANSTAYDDTVEALPGIGDNRALALIHVLAQGVTSRHDFIRIAVCPRIIAYAAESRP